MSRGRCVQGLGMVSDDLPRLERVHGPAFRREGPAYGREPWAGMSRMAHVKV